MNQLLTIDEAAKMLSCTPAAIRKWIYQGRLTAVKLGRLTRIRLEDIQVVMTKGLPEPGTCHQSRRRATGRDQELRSRVSAT